MGDMLVDVFSVRVSPSRFQSMRLKGFKQTVNPSYGDVVRGRPGLGNI